MGAETLLCLPARVSVMFPGLIAQDFARYMFSQGR